MSRTIVFLLILILAGTASAKEQVLMETSMGKIKLELDAETAPITVKNFLHYIDQGFYDGTIFHRVIDGFMIQGGGFTPGLEKKSTRPPIRNEAEKGLRNKRGTIAMARTSVVDSATSQFFINLRDNPSLDHRGKNPSAFGYAVFGRVVEGMDVVQTIGKMKTLQKGGAFQNIPEETVIIHQMVRVKE